MEVVHAVYLLRSSIISAPRPLSPPRGRPADREGSLRGSARAPTLETASSQSTAGDREKLLERVIFQYDFAEEPEEGLSGGDVNRICDLQDLLETLVASPEVTASASAGVWKADVVRQRGRRVGSMVMQGSHLSLVVICEENTIKIREKARRVLAAIETAIQSPLRSAEFRNIMAPSNSLRGYASVQILLEFSREDLLPHCRVRLKPHCEAELGEMPIAAERFGPVPNSVWAPGRDEVKRGRGGRSAAWHHVGPADFGGPSLQDFTNRMADEHAKSVAGRGSLWDLSLCELAVHFYKEDSVEDIVRFMRFCYNHKLLDIVSDVTDTDIFIPTIQGAGGKEEDWWLDFIQRHALPIEIPIRTFEIVLKTMDGYDSVGHLMRRLQRTVDVRLTEDALLQFVRGCLQEGLIKQVHVVPIVDLLMFPRDCALSGLDSDTVRRLKVLEPHLSYSRYTLEELLALVNLRDGAVPPMSFEQLVEDLTSLDHCVSWFVVDSQGRKVPQKRLALGQPGLLSFSLSLRRCTIL